MNRRVLREIATLTQNEIEGAYFEFWDENDIYNFHGFIVGPPDTPYEGGQFWFHIELPKEYPFKSPKFIFKTKIFHPNVLYEGLISMDILNENWSPYISIINVIEYVKDYLINPGMYLANYEATLLYFYNYDRYYEIAKEWTQKYANSPF